MLPLWIIKRDERKKNEQAKDRGMENNKTIREIERKRERERERRRGVGGGGGAGRSK